MKIDCDVPCGLDPRAIKRAFAAAWKQAAHDTGWNLRQPHRIGKLIPRKGDNPAWVPRMGQHVMVSVHVYMNPRRTQRQHAQDWYRALGGNIDHVFAEFPETPFPKKPAPKKRVKREPVHAERLAEARARVEEWEGKRKTAERALRLAKTKLRKYKAQVRALEREMKRAAKKTTGFDDRAFAAQMRERRRAREAGGA